MTVAEACTTYLHELAMRNRRKSTLASYRSLFRQLEAFARDAGIEYLEGIDKKAVRKWREQWDCAHSTQAQTTRPAKAFLLVCQGRGSGSRCRPLIGILSPRSDARPTMPLSIDELTALLAASNAKPKEQALLLTLRYSGLAIADARHAGAILGACRGRAGLAPVQERRARHGPPPGGSTRGSGRDCSTREGSLLLDGDIRSCHGSQLLAHAPSRGGGRRRRRGISPTPAQGHLCSRAAARRPGHGRNVSTLLGHSSVRTTEQYYAPWNHARRSRLVSLVREVHQQDPLLLAFTPKKTRRDRCRGPCGG